jgi:inosose dehydratase
LEFEGVGKSEIPAVQMLDELAATGYTGTELGDWGFLPTDAEALARELRQRRLAITGAFVPVALRFPQTHSAGEETALRVARLLADAAANSGQESAPYLVLADDNGADPIRTQHAGRAGPSMSMSQAEWEMFARGANRIARSVYAATGLRTVFHHHCAGFVETPDEIDQMLAVTDPEVVGLVFDTGHYAFAAGGCNTLLQALERMAGRIWYVHFKDCDPMVMMRSRAAGWDYFTSVRNGIFCELGKGCVDFPAIKAWLEEQNYSGYVTVEQDVLPGMGSPKESAQRNRDYLRSIGL